MKNQMPHNRILEVYKKTLPSMRYKPENDFFNWQTNAKEKLSELLGMNKFFKVNPENI